MLKFLPIVEQIHLQLANQFCYNIAIGRALTKQECFAKKSILVWTREGLDFKALNEDRKSKTQLIEYSEIRKVSQGMLYKYFIHLQEKYFTCVEIH